MAVFMYRKKADGGVDAEVFDSVTDVPRNQGWTDSPAKVDEAEVKPARRKAKT